MHAALPALVLYVPATQGVHGPDPSGPEKPTLHVQAATAELEIAELELVGHVTQVATAEAPTVVEYVPVVQSAHAALPVTVLYLPATQAVHGPDPSGPEKPTLHVQAATTELETGAFEFEGHDTQEAESLAPTATENEPTPQAVHAALPLLVLYFPATQAVHDPSGPVFPAEHAKVQFAKLVLANALDPSTPHVVHAPLPDTFLYVPDAQATHGPPPGPEYPGTHMQPLIGPVPDTEVEKLGHDVQLPDPEADLYFPATHAVHVARPDTLSAPVYPAEQRVQSDMFAAPPAPVSVHVPTGQAVHSATEYSDL